MAKYSHLFRIISFFVVITSVLCSCGNNTKQKDAKEREGILKELTSYQERLPYTVPGTKFTITDISVENDIVVYTCSVFNEDWDAMSMSSNFVSSDRNMARVISGMSSDAVNNFINHGIGLKYIYTSKETGEKLLEIEMSSEKLKEVRDKVESGEIEVVVIEAAAVVAKGLAQGGILHFVQRSEQGFSIHVCNTGFFCRVIEVFGVGSVMLSKMGLDSQGVNHGFKSIIRIR